MGTIAVLRTRKVHLTTNLSGVPVCSGIPDMALSGKNHIYFHAYTTKQASAQGWNWKGCGNFVGFCSIFFLNIKKDRYEFLFGKR